MGNFFTFKYWFNMNPGALAPKIAIVFYVFLGLLFLGIIVFTILRKNKKGAFYKIFDRLQGFAIGNLIIGLLLWFFTSQLVPVLSSRFWFALWAIALGLWFWFIFRDIIKIPENRKKIAEEAEFRKYIP